MIASAIKGLGEVLFKELGKLGIEAIKLSRSHDKNEVDSDPLRIDRALADHYEYIARWSDSGERTLSFGSIPTDRSYVPQDVHLIPRKARAFPDIELKRVPLAPLLVNPEDHIVLLGVPGAGKTTSMKMLCQAILRGDELFHEQEYAILIQLRDFNTHSEQPSDYGLIVNHIQGLLDIDIYFRDREVRQLTTESVAKLRERIICRLLEARPCVLLLDGLDEVVSARKRVAIVKEINRLTSKLIRSRVVLTSRTGEFDSYPPQMLSCEIALFNERQKTQFAINHLGAEDARNFLDQINSSPYADTLIRPLTLAQLCSIYIRNDQKIPKQPKVIYRILVRLLLKEWTEQRAIEKRRSNYAGFDEENKENFLADIAFRLTWNGKRGIFSRDDLNEAYIEVCRHHSLPKGEAAQVVREIESHTGIFLQAGQDLFEFSHPSLQEYFTALFIGKLPEIPKDRASILKIPNELAIAVALSSRPGDYLASLVLNHLRKIQPDLSFLQIFIGRLFVEVPELTEDSDSSFVALVLVSLTLYALIKNMRNLADIELWEKLDSMLSILENLAGQFIDADWLINTYDATPYATLEGRTDRIWRLSRRINHKFDSKAVLMPDLWLRESFLRRYDPGGQHFTS